MSVRTRLPPQVATAASRTAAAAAAHVGGRGPRIAAQTKDDLDKALRNVARVAAKENPMCDKDIKAGNTGTGMNVVVAASLATPNFFDSITSANAERLVAILEKPASQIAEYGFKYSAGGRGGEKTLLQIICSKARPERPASSCLLPGHDAPASASLVLLRAARVAPS